MDKRRNPAVPPPRHPLRASASYAELVSSLIYDLLGSTNIRLSILDTEGNCISQQGSFDIICQYAHSDTFSYAVCRKCSHQAVDEARRLARPYTYRCYMGLAVTAFPLLHEGICEGFLLMNGYSMEREEMERLPIYRDELDLARYFPGLEIREDDRLYLPKVQVDAMIRTVSTTISYLDALNSQVASLMELHNRSIELLTTANVKAQTENKDLMRLVQEASYADETDFFWGVIDDKFGTPIACRGLSAAYFFMGGFMLLAIVTKIQPIIYLSVICIAFATGGIPNLTPSVYAYVYGRKQFMHANKIVGPMCALISAPGTFVYTKIQEVTGSFIPVYVICMIAAAISFIVFMMLKKSYDPERLNLKDATVMGEKK